MSVKFDDFLKEQLQDPEIKKEYDDLQPERAIISAAEAEAAMKSGTDPRDAFIDWLTAFIADK